MNNPYRESYRQELIDNSNLAIFTSGLQSCTPNHSWGPGIRDHYIIHLIISGEGNFTVDNTTYNLKPGDMFLIKPSQLVHYTADSDNPWEYYWVGFNGTNAQKLVSNLPFTSSKPVYSTSNFEYCKEMLYQIYKHSGSAVSNSTNMLGYLYLFLAELIEENDKLAPAQSPARSNYVFDAIKYIQFNYATDIHVDDIAKAVGISRSHLYRVFIADLDQSPIDYLTEYRINEACNLLKNSDLSISQIATSVGFIDQFYFSRVFKKIKKIPPSKYARTQGDL